MHPASTGSLLIEAKASVRWGDPSDPDVFYHVIFLEHGLNDEKVVVSLIREGPPDSPILAYLAPDLKQVLYCGLDLNEAHQVICQYVIPRTQAMLEDTKKRTLPDSLRAPNG